MYLYNIDVPATFTKRIVDVQDQELVGNKNKYIPVCRKHLQEIK